MTDKKQQEQDCCKWIKTYWLEILLGVFTVAITATAIWQWGWLTGTDEMYLLEMEIRYEHWC